MQERQETPEGSGRSRIFNFQSLERKREARGGNKQPCTDSRKKKEGNYVGSRKKPFDFLKPVSSFPLIFSLIADARPFGKEANRKRFCREKRAAMHDAGSSEQLLDASTEKIK